MYVRRGAGGGGGGGGGRVESEGGCNQKEVVSQKGWV